MQKLPDLLKPAASPVTLDRQVSPCKLLLNSVSTKPADIHIQGQCSLMGDIIIILGLIPTAHNRMGLQQSLVVKGSSSVMSYVSC